jgi:hypothetical protein
MVINPTKTTCMLIGTKQRKAMMHTYFSWQDNPGRPLHSAVRKTALDNNKDIAKAFNKLPLI